MLFSGVPRRVQLQTSPSLSPPHHLGSNRGLHLARHPPLKLGGHGRAQRTSVPDRASDLQPAQEVGGLAVPLVHVGPQRLLSHHLQHHRAAGARHPSGDGSPLVEDPSHLFLRSHRRISRDLHHGPECLPRRSNLNLLLS